MPRLPQLAKWHLRVWALGLLAMLAWILLSLGWSWFLVTHTFERDIQSRLLARAHQLAQQARDQLQASLPAIPPAARTVLDLDAHPELIADVEALLRYDPHIVSRVHRIAQFTHDLRQASSGTAARPVIDLENHSELQANVEALGHFDVPIAYAMIWTEDGRVIAHSRRELVRTSLDSTLWPALESQQGSRLKRLNVPELSRDARVLEATVPLVLLGRPVAYVSIAYPQEWLDEEFWRTQGQLLLGAVGYTLAGVLVLFLIIHFAVARTERRRTEIQQTARARTSLLTERGMLASVLAHEVRSPLTALRFNLHSLRTLMSNRSPDIDRQLELNDRCEREIRRLDGMLNDFLQRTQVIGPVESASVNTVVSEAIEFLRPALERKHIHISIHLDTSDALVHVHPDELRQVILNLATNAHEAMPKGGTLAVSTLAEEAPPSAPATTTPAANNNEHREGTVTILIRDSGTGIPPELHERIFEPFFSTKPSGSGLGLALVRRVISGAGGSVTCESLVNAGTTFRIVLPRAEAHTQRSVPPGYGYAHIRRDDPALDLDQTPEIVIDQQNYQKPVAGSQKPEEQPESGEQ